MSATLLFAGLALAVPGEASAASRVKRVAAQNGIEAWLVEEHAIPIVAIEIGFAGGAALDPPEQAGRAALFSAMLTGGAGEMDATAYAEALEALATSITFSASRDRITLSLRTLSENLDESLALLRLALLEPRFDASEFARIQARALSSLREEEKRPRPLASKAFFAALFPDHAYGRPVGGAIETVEALTAEALREALPDYLYDRTRMKIGVVGAVSEEALREKLDALFADMPIGQRAELPAPEIASPPSPIVVRLDVPQSTVLFGHRGIVRADPDFIAAYVLNYVLGGGGFSSRLTGRIREQSGLAYSVYSYLAPFRHAGLVIGSMGTAGRNVPRAIALVREEWRKMAMEGVSEEELIAAKRYLTGAFALNLDSNAKIARFLVSMQMEDLGVDYLERRNGMVEAVSREDLRRVAERLLDPDGLFFVVVGEPEGL